MGGDRARPASIAALALTVMTSLAFVVTADNPVTRADAHAVRWIAERRSPAVEDLALAITSLGAWPVLLLLGLAAGAALGRRLGLSRRVALLPVAALTAAVLVGPLAKAVVDRPRPPGELAVVLHTSTGYPSGHAGQAMAFWLALGLVWASATTRARTRRQIVGGTVAVAVVVGLTRVVLGVHSPTDVVGGWCLGAACAFLASLALSSRAREPST